MRGRLLCFIYTLFYISAVVAQNHLISANIGGNAYNILVSENSLNALVQNKWVPLATDSNILIKSMDHDGMQCDSIELLKSGMPIALYYIEDGWTRYYHAPYKNQSTQYVYLNPTHDTATEFVVDKFGNLHTKM